MILPEIPARVPTPPPSQHQQHLTLNTSISNTPAQVPNKHIPYCSPGPVPQYNLSPPASPPSPQAAPLETTSLLYPPIAHKKLTPDSTIYTINAATLSKALDHIATQPLPDPKLVFPWFHGLHPENHFQLSFFDVRKASARRIPRCLRGITIVKAGGNLGASKLKGAISPEELLLPVDKTKARSDQDEDSPCFINIDPKVGFGVRNFQIQACKMATVSDIVVYGDDSTPKEEVKNLAALLSKAQRAWSLRSDVVSTEETRFNTFILTDTFSSIVAHHPHLVSIDRQGVFNPNVMDFPRQERLEMCALSAPSEIATNVWLGPSPDSSMDNSMSIKTLKFDAMIEATDLAPIPDNPALQKLERFLSSKRKTAVGQMSFPSSGSIAPGAENEAEQLDGMLRMCQWVHRLANAGADHSNTAPSKFFIHCADGYTETTLLALAYVMYAEKKSAGDAWIWLHREKNRNFFAYTSDKTLLEHFQVKLAQSVPGYATATNTVITPSTPSRGRIRSGSRSPKSTNNKTPAIDPEAALVNQPIWMSHMDGSLPSRILPYLYLGNLTHANNPGLLRNLNIKRVLSVGEPIHWPSAMHSSTSTTSRNDTPPTPVSATTPAQPMSPVDNEKSFDWPLTNFLYIDKVQDNGLDPLTCEFSRCLNFIEEGKAKGEATLVHCRVGVSRSATICIAEVMRELGLGMARA